MSSGFANDFDKQFKSYYTVFFGPYKSMTSLISLFVFVLFCFFPKKLYENATIPKGIGRPKGIVAF